MTIFENIDKNVGQIPIDSIIKSDCLNAMNYIPDNKIDLILSDLPYG
jgi:DNA modification methylase